MKEQIPFPSYERLLDVYDITKAVGGIIVNKTVEVVKFTAERLSGMNPYPLETLDHLSEDVVGSHEVEV